jgi:hypothetical protein
MSLLYHQVPHAKHVAALVHVMAMTLTGCSHGRHRFKNAQVPKLNPNTKHNTQTKP